MVFVFYVILVHIIHLKHKPGLFDFVDGKIMEQILEYMYAYAESKKESKKGWHYQFYVKKQVGKSHQFASIGDLILLEIHDVLKKSFEYSKATSSLSPRRPTDLPAHWAS